MAKALRESLPKHQLLRELLAEEVRSGKFDGDGKLPSERQLMRKHRVSYATVSRALNDLEQSGLVRREWGKGTFVQIQAVQQQHHHLAAVFGSLYDVTHPAVARFIQGVERAVNTDRICHVQIFQASDAGLFGGGETLLAQLLERRQIQGLILFTPIRVDEVERLQSMSVPVVSIDFDYPGTTAMAMLEDSDGAASQLAAYLKARGRQRVGMVMGPIADRSVRLVRASVLFYEALQEHLPAAGLTVDSRFILSTDYQWDPIAGTLEQWLADPDRPDAMVFRDDMLAQRFVDLAVRQGVDIPNDLMVVSFGDLLRPSNLTSVHVPYDVMGEAAVQSLSQVLRGESPGERVRYVTTRLVSRDAIDGNDG